MKKTKYLMAFGFLCEEWELDKKYSNAQMQNIW